MRQMSAPPAGSMRRCAAAIALTLGAVTALTAAAGASPAAKVVPSRISVVPVPGDNYAPAGTDLTFRGVSPSALAGLSVVGSKSGRHPGTLRAVQGGSVFAPEQSFLPGERVTVHAPLLDVTGSPGAPYTFATAGSVSRSAAAAALAAAARTDEATGSRPHGNDPLPGCPAPTYYSEPQLHAQGLCMNLGVTTSGTESGTYLFLTPGSVPGAGIYQDNGQLVWWQSTPVAGDREDNNSVVQYGGQPYMAIWAGTSTTYGQGTVTLYNEHYQLVGQINPSGFPPGTIDLHEFRITPAGDALFGIYEPVPMPGNPSVTVLQYVVQEVSLINGPQGIQTGSLLYEWDSLTDVPTTQSQEPAPSSGYFDYFHGNAISPDGSNLIVSSRNTWGLYELDATTGDPDYGHVIWQVGAKGDAQLSGEPWCYQHDVTRLVAADTYSLFDDGGTGPGCQPGSTEHPARGLVITVNPSTTPASVSLSTSYTHNPPIETFATGSTQILPNGDMLVSWGVWPEVTEYSPTGAVKMDLSMTTASYRGLRFAWQGEPLTPPSIAATGVAGKPFVYASWNGSTEVTQWQVLAGAGPSSLSPLGAPVPKTGFETAIPLADGYPYVAVEALGATGAVLSTSATVPMTGYLTLTSAGAVTASGASADPGSPAPAALNAPAVAIAPTADGGGTWFAAGDGGVFAEGDAHFHGSLAGQHINAPVVGMAATPDGGGYWLVGADGGVFSFGDAHFHGSLGGFHLNAPIVGMAATPDGGGYWLVGADGGVFAFGDAAFHGSLAGHHLNAPVVGIAMASGGAGYWLVGADGGVFALGRAAYEGSAAGAVPSGSRVVGIASSSDGLGYWLLTNGGPVIALGDAVPFAPSGTGTFVGIAAAKA